MSLDSQARQLVTLEKKKARLEKQLTSINTDISKQHDAISKTCKVIGLSSSFS